MTSWLTKFKISAALDEGQPLPPSLRRKIDCSNDLSRFADSAGALHERLKEPPAKAELPPSMHSSIMRAVRAAAAPVAPRRKPAVLRWLPVPACAGLVLVGVWLAAHRPAEPSDAPAPLATAATALELGQNLTQTMPAALTAPLSDEWQRLGRDLDQTAEYLLASLP